ncbi:MAG: hypothetical protein KDC87_12650 [Planctomycetes bacterium]|nr:hypothetical protein [Planctomycetota bacterium]
MSDAQLGYLPPDADRVAQQRLQQRGATLGPLRRRGHHLGFLVRRAVPEQPEDLAPLWAADLPIHLPGVLAGGLEVFAEDIAASLAMFDRLRRGRRFLDELARRLAHQDVFVPAGSTFDRCDDREIEKIWMRAVDGGGSLAEELWAKLSWVAHDEADLSLRVMFSSGVEQLQEWRQDSDRARFADAACEEAFPECRTISGHVPLVEALQELLGTPLRFSERILYANAPGGGAVFHHDVEPGQLGVVFGQFAGSTAWFALPKKALAEHLRVLARGTLASRTASLADALRLLDDENDPDRHVLLNESPELAQRLVEAGAVVWLEPGDALLLPNHGADDTCWHSVFALGPGNLGHSYGIFADEETP